ncbi:MAG: signal peptidase I [Oscillospiraceae bacterium]|nr:signal peptidase I [Oscillospiraceae bacterium]
MEKLKHLLKEYIIPLGTEALVILILFKFVFLLVMVPTGSMLPKIQEGGVIFCTHLHSLKNIERGDILVFESREEGKTLIKRLIGLPGELVEIDDKGTVTIDGEVLEEDYVFHQMEGMPKAFNVPEGHYLFLGDNRANSRDARYWDDPYIPGGDITAKARFTLWPLSRFGSLK